MQAWEIDKVEELTEEEQKQYYEKLVAAYKDEIKELKDAKKSSDGRAIASCSWRALLIAAAVGVIAGPLMMTLGVGAVKAAGDIVALSGIGMFASGLLGSIFVNDDGPKDIKVNALASKDAREKIKDLKAKIKEINKKPVMAKR